MSNKAKKWQEGEYVIRVTGNHITATKFIQEQKNFMNTTLDVTKAYKGIAACDPQDEFDLGEGAKMAMNRLNLLLNDKFGDNIKVGDTVKIVNFGKFYTTYCNWVDKNVTSSYDKCRYAFKQTPNNNIGKVLYMAKHESQNTMLAFIEVKTAEGYTDPCYLISVEGLKKL